MSDFLTSKTEIIIIIIICLLVAFIIGFNIIQVIDNKLNSVTINVPPQNCVLPPIYLNLDKDNNIKQIKLNDLISTSSNESMYGNTENFENLENSQNYSNNNINNDNDISLNNYSNENSQNNDSNNSNDSNDSNYNKENFGNLENYPSTQVDSSIIAGIVNSNLGNNITNEPNFFEYATDPNYNTVNNIPLLFSPDTKNPNQAAPDAIGYYPERLKLIENKNTPLMRLEEKNLNKLKETITTCDIIKSNTIPKINGPYDGYNSFVDLRHDSYANVTSIGKSMLTPYVSFPIPS